jgi:hypothetical protein
MSAEKVGKPQTKSRIAPVVPSVHPVLHFQPRNAAEFALVGGPPRKCHWAGRLEFQRPAPAPGLSPATRSRRCGDNFRAPRTLGEIPSAAARLDCYRNEKLARLPCLGVSSNIYVIPPAFPLFASRRNRSIRPGIGSWPPRNLRRPSTGRCWNTGHWRRIAELRRVRDWPVQSRS